jgi:hypothetical protein
LLVTQDYSATIEENPGRDHPAGVFHDCFGGFPPQLGFMAIFFAGAFSAQPPAE